MKGLTSTDEEDIILKKLGGELNVKCECSGGKCKLNMKGVLQVYSCSLPISARVY